MVARATTWWCLCALALRTVIGLDPKQFRVIKEWKTINFTFPNQNVYETALKNSDYVPGNILMAGMNHYESHYYLTFPRMKPGVPITLGRIKVNSSSRPLIEAFPSWEMNRIGDCSALQNVQNVGIDSKGLIWIIDGGKTNTLSRSPDTKCNPKLVIYNLDSNRVELTHNFESDVADREISFLYDIVIDGDFAYISDNSRIDPGLIVFDKNSNTSWKIKHYSMKADPDATEFTVDNTRIVNPINIAGLALSPKIHHESNPSTLTINEEKILFFSPISSTKLYSINTKYLKDVSYNSNDLFKGKVITVGNKGGQTDGMKMSNKGVLYFGLLPSSSIIKWNSSTPFVSNQITIAKDKKFIQWPNSFAFDDFGNILVLTNSLQKFVQGDLNPEEVNFRILKAFVDGKSYAYQDEEYRYEIDENLHQTNSEETTTTKEIPIEANDEEVTITKMTSKASTSKIPSQSVVCFVLTVTFGLSLQRRIGDC